MATDVHFRAGFGEREVRRAQADFRFRSEHLLGELQQDLLQVGERYVLVYIQAFYLVEEAMRTVADSFVAVLRCGTRVPGKSRG